MRPSCRLDASRKTSCSTMRACSELSKPFRQFPRIRATARLNDLPFPQEAWSMLQDVEQGADGRPLTQHHVANDRSVALRNAPEIAAIQIPGHVVDPKQKSILYRVVVDHRRKLCSPLGRYAPTVFRDG